MQRPDALLRDPGAGRLPARIGFRSRTSGRPQQARVGVGERTHLFAQFLSRAIPTLRLQRVVSPPFEASQKTLKTKLFFRLAFEATDSSLPGAGPNAAMDKEEAAGVT